MASLLEENLWSENNGFGPVLDTRKHRAWYIGCIVQVFFLFYEFTSVFANHSGNFIPSLDFSKCGEFVAMLSFTVSSLILGEILRRAVLFVEEYHHVDKRYNGSYWKGLKECMKFSSNSKVIYTVLVLSSLVTVLCWNSDLSIMSISSYASYVIISSLGMSLLKVKSLSPVEYSHLNEIENKHIAAGLAWGYYFGYLKMMLGNLPRLVNQCVEPKYKIEGTDARKHIHPILHILIPRNCFIQHNLESLSDKIKYMGHSLEIKNDVAGVKERSYKISAYRLSPDNKDPKYVIMEYASPLKNLYAMSRHEMAELSSKDLDREVNLFYKKLKFILESDCELKGRYKLILMSGTNQDDILDVLYRAIDDPQIDFE